jgi:hypothetical protein
MTVERFWKSLVGAMLLVTTTAVAPSYAAARARVYVRVGPPRAVAEVRVAAPGPNYVWVPGFHRWDGGAYVWVPGAWQLPPRPRAGWVPGHWSHDRRGWFFVEGHWR